MRGSDRMGLDPRHPGKAPKDFSTGLHIQAQPRRLRIVQCGGVVSYGSGTGQDA